MVLIIVGKAKASNAFGMEADFMRILVVEDEKKVASFIAKGFEQEGHAVDVVHDGEAGTHQAISFDYDMVILDVMLPKRSGFDVVGEV